MAVNSKPRFIPKEDIPFDKVDPVILGQSSMQVKMIFEMAKVRFNSICGFWNIVIIQVTKHVRQRSFDS